MACCAKHARCELAAMFHGSVDGMIGFVSVPRELREEHQRAGRLLIERALEPCDTAETEFSDAPLPLAAGGQGHEAVCHRLGCPVAGRHVGACPPEGPA